MHSPTDVAVRPFSGLVLAALCLLLWCGGTGTALGYGNAGHETVGQLAAHHLKGTRAEKELENFLWPNETLSKLCTWMDRAKLPAQYLNAEMREFVTNNPRHHKYHYCDVPFQETAYRLGGTGTWDDDIVQMMRRCIRILKDPKAENPTKLTRRMALLVLLHLAGDIHQPLHVGTSYVDKDDKFVNPDRGGVGQEDAGANNFKINGRTSLHGHWDTIAVKLARDKAPDTDFTAYLLAQFAPKPAWGVAGAVETWPEQWANDTLQLSPKCYENITLRNRHTIPADDKHPAHDEWVVTLPADYGAKSADVVEVQLAKAGWRLAEMLKAIFP